MADFQRLGIQSLPPKPENSTAPVDPFWKPIKERKTFETNGPVQFLEFSPISPFDLAITSSVKVGLVSGDDLEISKSLTGFKEAALGGSFRADGRLLAAGGAESIIRVYDLTSRGVLRAIRGHKEPVHCVKFSAEQHRIISFSDDESVRLWDLASGEEIRCYREHNDYVRRGVAHATDANIFCSASYDHSSKLFDSRCDASVSTFDHEAPVESVVLYPSGRLMVTAGATSVKVWDLASPNRVVNEFSVHHKTVTCLCLAADAKYLCTGSIDRHVKMIAGVDFRVVHEFLAPSPVLSIAASPDGDSFAIGLLNGQAGYYRREPAVDPVVSERRLLKRYNPAQYPLLKEHIYVPRNKDVFEVRQKRRPRYAHHDMHLKSFDSLKAFNHVVTPSFWMRRPEMAIATLLELVRRGTIRNVFAGASPGKAAEFLRLMTRHAVDLRFAAYLPRLIETFFDARTNFDDADTSTDAAFAKLEQQIGRELEHHSALSDIGDRIEQILGDKTTTSVSDIDEWMQAVPTTTDFTGKVTSVVVELPLQPAPGVLALGGTIGEWTDMTESPTGKTAAAESARPENGGISTGRPTGPKRRARSKRSKKK